MKKGRQVDGWLDREAAAQFLGLTIHWLNKHATTDKGPRFIQHGRKAWYRRDDLDAWVTEQRRAEVTEGAASLESLVSLGDRNRAQQPSASDLQTRYLQEWGEPEVVPQPSTRERAWREFCNTLSPEQRSLWNKFRASR